MSVAYSMGDKGQQALWTVVSSDSPSISHGPKVNHLRATGAHRDADLAGNV